MDKGKEIKNQIQKEPLNNRLSLCQSMISEMCSKSRGPKMSIPPQWSDEDLYITQTLKDAHSLTQQLEETQAQLKDQENHVTFLNDTANGFRIEFKKIHKQLKEEKAKNEWISVKDRLPENNDRVEICSIDAISTYGYPYNYHDACEMGFYDNGKWFSDTMFNIIEDSEGRVGQRKLAEGDDRWQDLEEVTHWKPLPQPPKEGE